ncbi:MAG TPA: YicC family protein [Phaeodactylibacter sp.]|nr:YicC family protein [Phaeodactylibacter sp.]
MTGYGQASGNFQDKKITVEVRSLNSKFTDMRFKMPQNYKEKEHEMRKIISEKAERGKIDININVESLNGGEAYSLNKALFKKYFNELDELQKELNITSGDLTQTILRIPNVVIADTDTLEKEEWETTLSILHEALNAFQEFRKTEGESLEKDCKLRIENIKAALQKLDPHEKERVEKIRSRMLKNMEEYVGKDNIDANRYEQEILYYLEKIDVTEEKVRLDQHCKYFLEVMSSSKQKGRKLNFISQEIGREINTLGSKANSSQIQHLVVQMKDELEKIKELVANSV